MTPEQYYTAVKKLSLTPSKNVPTVFLDGDGMTYNVPNPHNYTPDQRAEIIAKLKDRLGIEPREE